MELSRVSLTRAVHSSGLPSGLFVFIVYVLKEFIQPKIESCMFWFDSSLKQLCFMTTFSLDNPQRTLLRSDFLIFTWSEIKLENHVNRIYQTIHHVLL